jgi:transcription antitermination factor NusG
MDSPSQESGPEKQNPYGMDDHEKRWFAVYTGFKREKVVHKRLEEKGVEVYLPLQQFTRYYTRKVRKVEIPLISCYIFVKINRSQYVSVLETPDVYNFIKFENRLVAIPDREIELLRHIVGEDVALEVSQGKVEIGQEAEIIGGRLTGLRGKVVAQKGEKNFVIELDQLRYNLHLQVPTQYLKPLRRAQG